MDRTYCIFGDSVMQAAYIDDSWVNQTRKFLEYKYSDGFVNLFNLGIGGNTTTNILDRFLNESNARKPTHIIFSVGVNDSGYFHTPDNPITDSETFENNVRKLIKLSKQATENVLFIGFEIGDESLLKPFPGSSHGMSYDKNRVKDYNESLKSQLESEGINFVDLARKLEYSDFDDGLHPNQSGHTKIFEAIKSVL